MPSVIFICTANICRSPMASELFKQIVAEEGDPEDWKIDSAGTWAVEGQPIIDGTRTVLEKRGIPISSHSAKKANHELLTSFALILSMERGQKESIKFEFPDLKNRVYQLSEMIDQEFNIEDPYGRSDKEYERTAKLLEKILVDGFQKIEVLSCKSI